MRPEKMTSMCGLWNWGRYRKATFTATLCTMTWTALSGIYGKHTCKDKTTADPQPTLDDVKEKFEQALEQGSQEEVVIHEFCDRMQIPFEKISSEDFSAFLRILSLSKQLKSPNNMRGKTKPQPYYAPKRKKRR